MHFSYNFLVSIIIVSAAFLISRYSFSRAWRPLHVVTFDWFTALSASFVIGQSDYCSFHFMTLKWKPLDSLKINPFYGVVYSFPLTGVNAEGKVDRPTWKAIQQVMNDSQKFVESLHTISWKEGLSEDILKGVQSFLAASNGGDVNDSDLGTAAPGLSASTYQSSPGRASVNAGTVCGRISSESYLFDKQPSVSCLHCCPFCSQSFPMRFASCGREIINALLFKGLMTQFTEQIFDKLNYPPFERLEPCKRGE